MTDGQLTIHRVVGRRRLPSNPTFAGFWVDAERDGVQRMGQNGQQVILPGGLKKRSDPPPLFRVGGFVNVQLGVDGESLVKDLSGVQGDLWRLRFEEITEKE